MTPDFSPRLGTLEELLHTLDHLFAGGTDWTSREQRDHWQRLFSQPAHPLNSEWPDTRLPD